MAPQLYGTEHILYIIISTLASGAALLLAKKHLKTEKAIRLFLRVLAALLFAAIAVNRLSMNYYFGSALIPDSFCGMTSLVLALAVLFGKRNNSVLHFVWLLGLFGGVATVLYATFLDQNPSFFFLPTISGLLHHSLCAMLVVALLLFRQIDITYNKWYCTFFGFTTYLTLGAFLMQVYGLEDAFHIAQPLISDTPLTAWVMAPIYAVAYGLILLGVELARKRSVNV